MQIHFESVAKIPFYWRATKLVPVLADLPYENRLSKFSLTILKKRRSRGDMIEVFKILKGFHQVHGEGNYLKLAPRHSHLWTRDHNLKLQEVRH